MMGLAGVRQSFASNIQQAHVAVVEGVMGLYDGIDGGDDASTAQVAKTLGIPVILVVNVHGMSRSAAALILGYTSFDPEVKIAGVILNRVGSERHLSMLREAIDFPILGAIPRKQEIALPSRHLGLEMGFESNHDPESLAAMMEEHADLDRILKLQCSVPDMGERPENKNDTVRIGIAYDHAFCFYYHDNFDILRNQGAELVFFSPLRDPLPDVYGLYLGGGYPELYPEELEKAPARLQIKRAAEEGLPIYGECGGLIYLGEELVRDDRSYKMAGVLPATTIMTRKLQALGYVEAQVVGSNPVAEMGLTLRGHEFHYSRMDLSRDARLAYHMLRGRGIDKGRDGLTEHNTLGSYLHSHFISFPVSHFLKECSIYKGR
jgi:cobyrinic acid a,c-diamide synthase